MPGLDFAVRRPRLILCLWLVAVGCLGIAGARIERRLQLIDPVVPGTSSAHAKQQAQQAFGQESAFAALLEGPAKRLDESGPHVAAALARIPHVSVVSPWLSGGPRHTLRPEPTTAVIVLGAHEPFESAGTKAAPRIRSTLRRTVPPHVTAHLAGYPEVTATIRRAASTGLGRAELIAGFLLAVLLLLVFRSVVAAGVPLFLGFSTVAAVRGLLALINSTVVSLDVTALSLASMFGLALGVDYSLLLVSRFREQLAEGESPAQAARTASETAGHTVMVAGVALVATLAALYLIAPEPVTGSASLGGLVAVIVSVAGARLALPALLTLIGANVDRWQLGARRDPTRRNFLAALAWRAIPRPLLFATPAIVLLLALCGQALSVKLSPPHDTSLPQSSVARSDVHAIDRRLGSGWVTPYEVVIRARHGLITDPRTLYAMTRWERRLEADHRVAGVVGPQTVYGGEEPPSRSSAPYPTQAEMGLELLRDAPPEQRGALKLAINLDRGGTALRMYVIERTGHDASLAGDRAALPGDPLRGRLEQEAAALERATGTRILVGGPAATLQDFTSSDERLLPILIVLLCGITFLILMFWIRAVPIALASVGLNAVTVGATVGVLVLCFQRPALFGPADALGAAVIPGVVAVSFALAIDYEVFLLARVREGVRLAGGDIDRGLRYALDRTAGVISGAALIMCGVFVAFATAGLADLREYGIGLAVAVTIDATIVRLVLLPTLIRLLGPRGWWSPAALNRLLARLGGLGLFGRAPPAPPPRPEEGFAGDLMT